MTTREAPAGKEKRGTSPSSLPGTRTSPYKKPASPASQKAVPNYLKPTRSSDPEAFKQQGKKPITSKPESFRKPDLVRRKSLDKPPPAYQSQRSRVRSSSEKTPEKQSTLYAKPITRTRKVKNEDHKEDKGKDVVHPRQVENVNAPVVPELLMQSGDICEEKRDEDLWNGNQKPASDSEQSDDGEICEEGIIGKTSDQEPTNDEQVREDGEDRDAKVATYEHQKALLEIEKTQGGCEDDKDESTVIVEDMHIINDYEETGNNDVETPSFELPDTPQHQSPKIESVEALEKQYAYVNERDDAKQEDDITSNITNDEKSVEGNVSGDVEEKRDRPANDSEEGRVTYKEKEDQDVVKVQMAHGKKEIITVSNDVIEETASKLREQRKNKVKALAGAFETVISLQDPK